MDRLPYQIVRNATELRGRMINTLSVKIPLSDSFQDEYDFADKGEEHLFKTAVQAFFTTAYSSTGSESVDALTAPVAGFSSELARRLASFIEADPHRFREIDYSVYGNANFRRGRAESAASSATKFIRDLSNRLTPQRDIS